MDDHRRLGRGMVALTGVCTGIGTSYSRTCNRHKLITCTMPSHIHVQLVSSPQSILEPRVLLGQFVELSYHDDGDYDHGSDDDEDHNDTGHLYASLCGVSKYCS